jgi:hypothetical protein
MVVFVSSVRRGLEVERDALPGLIRALGHEPKLFEDFTALPVPPRQACLDGVDVADVYLLLLGERYGDAMPDTGIAPTEEEFNAAVRKGIPVIVFRRSGVAMEPNQTVFAKRVEDYQAGRFRDSFSSPTDLLAKVAAALRQLHESPAAVTIQQLDQPVPVPWLGETGRSLPGRGTNSTTLEVHLIPVESPRLPASALEEGRGQLISVGRRTLLFGEEQAVNAGSDTETVWAAVQDRGSPGKGIRLSRSGVVSIWRELARDSLGSLLSIESLTDDLVAAIRIGAVVLRPSTMVALTAGLDPVAMAGEGDPGQLGKRTQATISRFATGGFIRLPPEVALPQPALDRAAKDVAQELAVRLLQAFRSSR